MSAKPTAVIFDIGDVLYRWDPHGFFDRRVPDASVRDRFLSETSFFEWHYTLDGGRALAEAGAELTGRFPEYAHLIAAWSDDFGESISDPVPGMPALVQALDERGVPLFAITNFSADFWKPFHARERSFFSHFRDIVVSGQEKLLKPDPAIYQLALDRFGLISEQALFVDDRAINVDGARAIGMHAHLFTDAADLRARLHAEALL